MKPKKISENKKKKLIGKNAFLVPQGGVVYGKGRIYECVDSPYFAFEFRNETGVMRFNNVSSKKYTLIIEND